MPTLILDKNQRPDDSWRKRYKSLCLHDPVWYDHLPYLMELGFGDLYSEAAVAAGISTERADLTLASLPYRAVPALQKPMWEEIRRRDAGFYARLEKAGFQRDFGEDDTGLWVKALRRGGGFYIDVGASELVADGRIKLKSRVGVEHIEEHAVVLTDGSELPADLIVFATGYGSMNAWVEQLISKEVADKVGKCWGLGSESVEHPCEAPTRRHTAATTPCRTDI